MASRSRAGLPHFDLEAETSKGAPEAPRGRRDLKFWESCFLIQPKSSTNFHQNRRW